MGKAIIKMNDAGVQAILKSEAMQSQLQAIAGRIAAAANSETGGGFRWSGKVGYNRALAQIWTDTREAREAEATRKTLTRAYGAGR